MPGDRGCQRTQLSAEGAEGSQDLLLVARVGFLDGLLGVVQLFLARGSGRLGGTQQLLLGVELSEGTGIVPDAQLEAAVRKVFRLTPSAIIESLGLAQPIFRKTAAYGHFGRDDIDLPWERCDHIEALKSALVPR